METLVGSIYRVLYESTENDFKVFMIRQKDNSVIRITGEFPVLLPGAKIEVHGNYKTHHKYGLAFKSEAHTFDYDKSSAHSVSLYIQSIAKWVGPERSMAMAKYFGDSLQEVIEKTPERLVEVEGVGEKVASSLVEAWEFNREMKDIKIFLHSLGLTDLKIKRLIGQFGAESETILKGNPWILCQHGFGFTTCDHIAIKLEKDMGDTLRYQQFVIYVLNQSLNSGHLFLFPQQIVDAFNRYNSKATTPFKKGDLTIEEIAPHIKKLVEGAYIVNEGNRIYGLDSYFYETESARLLAKISTTKANQRLEGVDVEGFILRYEQQHGISLSDAQKDAIRSFVKEKVMVITGYPGTGKTTLVKAIVQIMKERGLSFELLTPTGIASKKLGMTVGCDAYTIHRRLGYKGKTWDCNALNKYSTDVIVCDELSMVDMEVFYRLISALFSGTHLIFVGDNDQLPSVGPGYVLKELIDSGSFKTIRLDFIFRQDKCSDIIKEAKKIRDGDADLSLFKKDKMADIWHIQEKDPDKIEKTIIRFATQLKDSNKVKKEKMYFQIITPRNEGPLSVSTLNTALQAALNPPDKDKKEITLNHTIIRKGDRVLIRKNNYELGVFNGDIGKVSFITPGQVVVDLDDLYGESKRVEIPITIADDMIKLAYCLTIHKIQGSEYPLVIIVLIKAHGAMLLQRNLLYTAITRAKKKVVILGQASAIESSILNDKIQKRNTLFAERIKLWMQGKGTSLRDIFSTYSNSPNAVVLERLLSLEERSS